MNKKLIPLFVSACSLLPASAFAQAKDIEVAARTFKFIEGAPSGTATLGVVADPSVAASQAQADAIVAEFGGGKSVGGLTITPKVVAPGDVSGVDMVFVTEGLGAQHSAIGAAAGSAGILSLSTDMACVDAGHCVMGVRAEPKVQIVVSRGATSAAGLTLNQALKMMIEERD